MKNDSCLGEVGEIRSSPDGAASVWKGLELSLPLVTPRHPLGDSVAHFLGRVHRVCPPPPTYIRGQGASGARFHSTP